jgi:hypothetical protein
VAGWRCTCAWSRCARRMAHHCAAPRWWAPTAPTRGCDSTATASAPHGGRRRDDAAAATAAQQHQRPTTTAQWCLLPGAAVCPSDAAGRMQPCAAAAGAGRGGWRNAAWRWHAVSLAAAAGAESAAAGRAAADKLVCARHHGTRRRWWWLPAVAGVPRPLCLAGWLTHCGSLPRTSATLLPLPVMVKPVMPSQAAPVGASACAAVLCC